MLFKIPAPAVFVTLQHRLKTRGRDWGKRDCYPSLQRKAYVPNVLQPARLVRPTFIYHILPPTDRRTPYLTVTLGRFKYPFLDKKCL